MLRIQRTTTRKGHRVSKTLVMPNSSRWCRKSESTAVLRFTVALCVLIICSILCRQMMLTDYVTCIAMIWNNADYSNHRSGHFCRFHEANPPQEPKPEMCAALTDSTGTRAIQIYCPPTPTPTRLPYPNRTSSCAVVPQTADFQLGLSTGTKRLCTGITITTLHLRFRVSKHSLVSTVSLTSGHALCFSCQTFFRKALVASIKCLFCHVFSYCY